MAGAGAPIGGLKGTAERDELATRFPRRILEEAQAMVNDTLTVTPDRREKS